MKLIKSIFSLFLSMYNKKKLLLVFIFFLSLLFCLIFLFFFSNIGPAEHSTPGADYFSIYKPTAESILHGKGFTINGELYTRVPPGYSLILSIIFPLSRLIGVEELKLIVLFNVLITAASSVLLFLIAESIFKKRIALISSLLWMTYPFNLWLIKNPNTEVPFILLFYFALWLYVLMFKNRSFKLALLSGTLLGFAALIRPIIILLPFFLALLIFFLIKDFPFNKKFILSSVLLIGYFLVISPWLIYVYMNTGNLIPLSALGSGSTIAGGLNTLVDKSKIVYEDKVWVWEKFSPPKDVVDLIERSRAVKMDSFSNVAHFFLQELRNYPTSFFKLLGIKMARSWYATSEMWLEKQILLLQSPYLILSLAGLIIFFKKLKDKTAHLFFLLMVIFYFWALSIATYSILRYMIPAMGLLMIFSASTVNVILNKLKKYVFFP